MKARYDAVVIGSGFGGAVAAYRLAQAGRSVAILEQGRRWKPNEFPRTIGRVARGFWQEGRAHGFLEYRTFRRMDVIQGVGVGGGSLHYFNVNVRTPADIFETRGWPALVRRPVLEPFYDAALAKLDSHPLQAPQGRQLPVRTTSFLEAARRAGKTPEMLNVAVYTGPDRTNAAGVPQSACTYCGNCMLGCHVQAKNTLDITYIAQAERLGAELFPLHKVSCLSPLSGGGYRVEFQSAPQADGPFSEKGQVEAGAVVVAAGALGSTELLLRCRDVHRTLPRLPQTVGQRFSGNGDFLFAGAWQTPQVIDPANGPSITTLVDCSTKDNRISVEDLGLPDPLLWFAEGALPPARPRLMDVLALVRDYLASAIGLGADKGRVGSEIAALLDGGRTTRYLPFLGMGTDAADGVLRLADGALDLSWSHRRSRKMFREMESAMRAIAEATGGRYVTSLLWRWPLRKLLTAHPLGGCVMGDAREDSVVDHRNQVWDHPNLYVTDGAALPSALSVNPSLTIAAVAERAAFWMIHGRERVGSDPALA